jgi:hypothetical protein
MRVFEERVLSNMFGSTKEEVPADWRQVHNEELHDW